MSILCDCYHCPARNGDECEDFNSPLFQAQKMCQQERTLFMQDVRIRA